MGAEGPDPRAPSTAADIEAIVAPDSHHALIFPRKRDAQRLCNQLNKDKDDLQKHGYMPFDILSNE